MNQTRWEPRALPRLQREINRVFDNLLGEDYAPDLLPGGGFPSLDISEREDAYVVTADLPGVKRDDIDISVADGVVTIKGEKQAEREEKGDTWYFSERQYGSFSRAFRLPADADEAAVEAELKDGVLTVTVPKSEPKAKAANKVAIKKS